MEKRNELAKELFVKIYFADNVDNTEINSDAIGNYYRFNY